MEIIPHVYQITIRQANIILIAEKELTLIDTGFRGSSPRILSFIHHLGRSAAEIRLIILTHNHLDHAGGLAELKSLTQATVAAHIADIGDVESQLPYRKLALKLLHIPLVSLFRPLGYAKTSEVDIQLKGGEVLSPLGGLQVIHTPGHTPGSVSLFAPKKKLLIVGDALNNRYRDLRLPPKLVTTNLRQAADSVNRIAQLDFDVVCFGHGSPLTKDAQASVRRLVENSAMTLS